MTAKNEQNLNLFLGWDLGEDGWNTGMDSNMIIIGALARQSVKSRTTDTKPPTPSDGDIYFVPASATGDWASYTNNIAVYSSFKTNWEYIPAPKNYPFRVEDESDTAILWNGAALEVVPDATGALTDASSYVGTGDIEFQGAMTWTGSHTANTTELAIVQDIIDAIGAIDYSAYASLLGTQTFEGDNTFTNPISGVDAVVGSDLTTLTQVEGLVAATTAGDVGGFEGLYRDKTGSTINIKSLQSSDGSVTIIGNTDDVDLKVNLPTVITDFTGLDDTPTDYSGAAGQLLAVNVGENALEFVTIAQTTTLLGLTDTPNDYVGNTGKALVVNATDDAVEFADLFSENFIDLNDTPNIYDSQAGFFLKVNSGEDGVAFESVDIKDTFTSLDDSPSAYPIGSAGYTVIVNPAEDGLEFLAPPAVPVSEFTQLNDTPNTYLGKTTQIPSVNGSENALEFSSISDLLTLGNFINLADTPTDYTLSANKVVAVNGAGDGLEFVNLSGLTPLGSWNATTNTPTLTDSDGVPAGSYYIVTGSGTWDLGEGPIEYNPRDWVVSNGVGWDHIDNSDLLGGQVNSIQEGAQISVDATDPVNPIVSFYGVEWTDEAGEDVATVDANILRLDNDTMQFGGTVTLAGCGFSIDPKVAWAVGAPTRGDSMSALLVEQSSSGSDQIVLSGYFADINEFAPTDKLIWQTGALTIIPDAPNAQTVSTLQFDIEEDEGDVDTLIFTSVGDATSGFYTSSHDILGDVQAYSELYATNDNDLTAAYISCSADAFDGNKITMSAEDMEIGGSTTTWTVEGYDVIAGTRQVETSNAYTVLAVDLGDGSHHGVGFFTGLPDTKVGTLGTAVDPTDTDEILVAVGIYDEPQIPTTPALHAAGLYSYDPDTGSAQITFGVNGGNNLVITDLEGSISVTVGTQTEDMSGGDSDKYIATKKYVDDFGFDTTAPQTITGEWEFDVSSGRDFQIIDDPTLAAPTKIIGMYDHHADLDPTALITYIHGVNPVSTATDSGYYIFGYHADDGSQNVNMGAGEAGISVADNGTESAFGAYASGLVSLEGLKNATDEYIQIGLQTEDMTGGNSDSYIATQKYVDDNVVDLTTPTTWTSGTYDVTVGDQVLAGTSVHELFVTDLGDNTDFLLGYLDLAPTYKVVSNSILVDSADTDIQVFSTGVFEKPTTTGEASTFSSARYYYDPSTGFSSFRVLFDGENYEPINGVTDGSGNTGAFLTATGTGVVELSCNVTGSIQLTQQTSAMNSGSPSDLAISTKGYTDSGGDKSGLKTGTLLSPPAGMAIGEEWLDTTDSAVHPIMRVSTVAT